MDLADQILDDLKCGVYYFLFLRYNLNKNFFSEYDY